MNKYKYKNHEKTSVQKYPLTFIIKGGSSWDEFQEYINGGGIVDPYKTKDELVSDSILILFQHHDSIIADNGLSEPSKTKKEQTKYNNALRRETKGKETANDISLLDKEDILDNWFDEMEIAAKGEDHGEKWIEDSARTKQELIDYDPSIVPWPLYLL